MKHTKQSCPCCKELTISDYIGRSDLLKCCNCGHVWTMASFSRVDIEALYSENYFNGDEYVDYTTELSALRRNFLIRFRTLKSRHALGARLFEIGAGYGAFLSEASSYFDVCGCDISDYAIRQALRLHNIRLLHADYLDVAFNEPQDVICLWDVIELMSPAFCRL